MVEQGVSNTQIPVQTERPHQDIIRFCVGCYAVAILSGLEEVEGGAEEVAAGGEELEEEIEVSGEGLGVLAEDGGVEGG